MQGELFSNVAVRRTIPATGLCASGGIHLLVLALIISWRFIGPTERLPFKPKNFDLQVIRYSLPAPLLFSSSGRQGSAGASQGGPRRASTKGKSGSRPSRPQAAKLKIEIATPRPLAAEAKSEEQTAALHEAAPPGPPKPVFQVPQKPAAPHRDLIIQPGVSPNVRISGKVELPNLFLWSQTEIRPLVRQLKPFVPGEVKRRPRSPAALPDAPPKLDLPNQEIKVTDLKIASAPQLLGVPTLPVSAATTSPVRIQRQSLEVPSELPLSALPPGQPVNLLAIMNSPAIPSASYTVEAGNRFPAAERSAAGGGPAGGTNGGAGESSGAASETAAGARGTSGASSDAGTKSGSGTASGNAPGSGPGGNPGGRGNGNPAAAGSGAVGSGPGRSAGTQAGSGTASGGGAGTGAGKGAGTGSGTGLKGSGTAAQGDGVGIGTLSLGAGSVSARTESPNTSAFEIVVVNQSAGEILPESAGVLTGQPVYTVYMAVPGSRSEWILQYAIPHSREPVLRQNENSIQLGAATPLRAPYPLRKGTMQWGEQGPPSGRVVVYGTIGEKGSVEDLRVIRGVRREVDAAVLACLRQFLFRPAVRDGVPVLVEALFGIPLD